MCEERDLKVEGVFPVNDVFGKLVMIKTPLAAMKINIRIETIGFKTDGLERICLP